MKMPVPNGNRHFFADRKEPRVRMVHADTGFVVLQFRSLRHCLIQPL